MTHRHTVSDNGDTWQFHRMAVTWRRGFAHSSRGGDVGKRMKEAQKEMVMSRTAVASPLPFCSPQAQTDPECRHRTSRAGTSLWPVPLEEQPLLKCHEHCTCSSDSSSPIPDVLLCVTGDSCHLFGAGEWDPPTSFIRGEFHFQKMTVSSFCQESSVQKTHRWHGSYQCPH